MRLSEAGLEAPDVGVLVRRAHPCGSGFAGGGQVGVLKGHPALRGPQLCGVEGVCLVGECAEWVRCSFLSTEGAVEPAPSDSEVVCCLLCCRLRPRFRRRECSLVGPELWVWQLEVVEVEAEKDMAGRHVHSAPAVAQGRAVGGQGCADCGHGYGPRVVRCVGHVVPSQVVPEGVGEWAEEAGVAGAGGHSWGCRPCAVVRVEVPAVGAVGQAVCGSQSDQVVWVAG